MKFDRIPGVDKPVSRLVQGCMMLHPNKAETNLPLLDAVLESGINTFDSSRVYGGGACDKAFGHWVRSRGVRDEIVLMDKGCHPLKKQTRVTPDGLTEDLHICLDHLGFDEIDIFAFHRDDPDVPVGELIDRIDDHIRAGLVHAWGVSNWTFDRFRAACDYAKDSGKTPPALVSPQYSLVACAESPWPGCLTITGDDHAEERAWYAENDTPVFNWSSLARGFLSGRYTRENLAPPAEGAEETDKDAPLLRRCFATEENFARLERARQMAKRRGVSVPQIALAWLLCGELNCFPLIACWKPEEAADNAQAVEIELSPKEVHWLESGEEG
jgi:aryl-alcohol dehydrogenase-like predicted oxidoreductase